MKITKISNWKLKFFASFIQYIQNSYWKPKYTSATILLLNKVLQYFSWTERTPRGRILQITAESTNHSGTLYASSLH
jgi:hypothetical protein